MTFEEEVQIELKRKREPQPPKPGLLSLKLTKWVLVALLGIVGLIVLVGSIQAWQDNSRSQRGLDAIHNAAEEWRKGSK